MSVALYRKYRPQNFSQISGQNHIKTTLVNEIESGKIGHAYLFCGPRGTGKTTLARLLSKAANCLDLQPAGEPCNKCDACTEMAEGKSLDVIEIDAASHTGVDNVRENIINNARFTPSKRKYKVFIIDEVHMLSISAFNALLKILEEPPSHVLFILATTEVHKVPVTIISRCQRFDYRKINIDDLLERLKWIVTQEGIDVDEAVLKRIAKYSFGCVRDSESLLEQVLSLGEKKITLELAELILPRSNFQSMFDLLKFLSEKNSKAAIELINNLMEEGIDIGQFTNDFIEFLRKCLLYKVKNDLSELSQEVEEKSLDDLIKILKDVSAADLVKIIGILMKSKDEFRQSYILQLPLELAIVDLCGQEQADIQPEVKKNPAKVVEEKKIDTTPQVEQKQEIKPQSIKVKEQKVEPEVKKVEVKDIKESNNPEHPEDQDVSVNPDYNNNEITLTFAQIKSKWPEIIQKIKKDNYSLSISLRVGQPVNLIGNKVIVAFPFKLQEDRVADFANKRIVEQALEEVFGQKLILETKIDNNIKKEFPVNDDKVKMTTSDVSNDDVKDALDIFGGSIVDS